MKIFLSRSRLHATDPLVGERDRAKVPEHFKWNLTDLYPDDATWIREKEKLLSELPSTARYRGRLAESPAQLLGCFNLVHRLNKELTRLTCYASLYSDLDTREAKYIAMEQEMGQISTDLASLTSFIEPEVLRMDPAAIDRFIEEEPKLAVYRHGLHNILRKKEHTGTESEEKIIANAGLISDSPNSIFTLFSNADFPFPEITLEDGRMVKLDQAAFSLHRRSAVREDRRKVFEAFLGRMNQFRRTFGAQLYAEIRKNIFFTRARRYGSCLERSLDGFNIPLSVYRNLIDSAHAHLGTLHRYLRLRRRLLGLDELHYYDLYAPVVRKVDLQYTYDEAVQQILASLAPLGEEYAAVARRVFAKRWVDVYANDGKRSGAYSNGSAYDVHPYILMNYNGRYDDMSTLTHELGHTMHSYLANTTQPYPTATYSIFVAEVASTFNEALLLEHMLRREQSPEVRLSLLANYLDNVRATVFRQIQFAEFELRIHETAERGQGLTGDLFSELYSLLVRCYHGHDAGVCRVDDEVAMEWAYIPHFYYNFYVYQYATSLVASSAILEQVLAGDSGAVSRYLGLLRAGGSDYPMELLRHAGVDMNTSAPFEATMRKLNRVMDEVESLAGV